MTTCQLQQSEIRMTIQAMAVLPIMPYCHQIRKHKRKLSADDGDDAYRIPHIQNHSQMPNVMRAKIIISIIMLEEKLITIITNWCNMCTANLPLEHFGTSRPWLEAVATLSQMQRHVRLVATQNQRIRLENHGVIGCCRDLYNINPRIGCIVMYSGD